MRSRIEIFVWLLLAAPPLTALAQTAATTESRIPFARRQFIAVSVADLETSTTWYQQAFATTRVVDLPAPADGSVRTRLLSSSDVMIELSQHTRGKPLAGYAGAPTPTFLVHGFFKTGFFVDDLESAAETLRARGVTTLGQIIVGDGGLRFVLFRDNAGNFLQLLEQRN